MSAFPLEKNINHFYFFVKPGLNEVPTYGNFMENYQIYGTSNSNFNGSRAFGREITNYLSNAQNNYSNILEAHKKVILKKKEKKKRTLMNNSTKKGEMNK